MRPILLLLPILLLATSCGKDWAPPEPRNLSIIVDHTDPHLLSTLAEDIPQIIASLGLDEDPWGGVVVRIKSIGAVPNDRVQELVLLPADPAETNVVQRASRVKRFKADVENVLRLHAIVQSKAEATMFMIAAGNELNFLAQRQGERLALFYTDALEHTLSLDMYQDSIMDSLIVHPDRYSDYGSAQVVLADLTGIDVVLANVAKNHPNGVRVQKAFKLAEGLYRSQGATVYLTGNFIYHAKRDL